MLQINGAKVTFFQEQMWFEFMFECANEMQIHLVFIHSAVTENMQIKIASFHNISILLARIKFQTAAGRWTVSY